MSFALGFMSGLGEAAHERNLMQYHADMENEHAANEGTVNMLKGIMASDSATPEMKNSAFESLQNFYRTPGMPNKKHRQAALEPVLTHFREGRPAPDAQHLESMAQQEDQQAQSFNPDNPGSQGEYFDPGLGMTVPTSIDRVNPATHAQAIRKVEGMVPERHGFLGSDEIAIKKGRAEGAEANERLRSMGIDPSKYYGGGAGSGGFNPRFDAKGGMSLVPKNYTVHNYEAPDGRRGIAYADRNSMTAYDENQQPLPPGSLLTAPDGTHWITATQADNSVTTQPVSNLTGTPRGQIQKIGVKETAPQLNSRDLRDTRTEASTESIRTNTQAAKIRTKVLYDPFAFPDTPTPPGLPIRDTPDGVQITGTTVDTHSGPTTDAKQRAQGARSAGYALARLQKFAGDPANADLFGKMAGKWDQLLVRGKDGSLIMGPIGTSDPRLTWLFNTVKSASDLLTKVHGRRSEHSGENFERSMLPVNSPDAFAGSVRPYQDATADVLKEGNSTIGPVTRRDGTVPGRNDATQPPVAEKFLTLDEMKAIGKGKQ